MDSKKYTDSTIRMFEYMDQGLSANEARKLVKPDKQVTRDAQYKLEQKYKQWALTNPTRVRKASKIIDNTLAGKPLTSNTDELPNNAQILGIVKEIMDRQYPKIVRNENLNVNVELSPVNLDQYKGK